MVLRSHKVIVYLLPVTNLTNKDWINDNAIWTYELLSHLAKMFYRTIAKKTNTHKTKTILMKIKSKMIWTRLWSEEQGSIFLIGTDIQRSIVGSDDIGSVKLVRISTFVDVLFLLYSTRIIAFSQSNFSDFMSPFLFITVSSISIASEMSTHLSRYLAKRSCWNGTAKQ